MPNTRGSGRGSTGQSRQPSTERQVVRARALVAGLAPSVVPMIIREWWPDGMRLAFDGQPGVVDERWATPGAGLLIIFKAMLGGEARRVSVHGRLRTRDPRGIAAQLVAVDEAALLALRSLAAGPAQAAGSATAVAKTPAAGPAMTADAIASLCLASIRQHLPKAISAYLDALTDSLHSIQSSTRAAPEHKRSTVLLNELAHSRVRMEQAIVEEALPSIAAYLGDERPSASGLETSGLSLLESIDLRATLLVTEAVENIAARLRGVWHELEQRLGQVVPQRSEGNALAPAVFCHHFRDAIFFDQQLGALRQIDLTAGYSEEFVACIEQMYRELVTLLDRQGVRAVAAPAGGERVTRSPPGRK